MNERAQRLQIFRDRLSTAISENGSTRTEVAERVGVDRSTLTQLLSPRNSRFPRLDTAISLAVDQGVSLDWLTGLSNEGPMQAEIIDTEFTPTGSIDDDEVLLGWFAESVNHKTRHVPSTIPDLVKTEAVIRYESTRREDDTGQTDARVEASAARLALTRSAAAELECCSPLQSLTTLASGTGIWSKLPRADRGDQLEHITAIVDELYPRFRWFLFDGTTHFASPITIFGPNRAALYLGHSYLVLTSSEHVRILIRDFEEAIKAASVQPNSLSNYVRRLKVT